METERRESVNDFMEQTSIRGSIKRDSMPSVSPSQAPDPISQDLGCEAPRTHDKIKKQSQLALSLKCPGKSLRCSGKFKQAVKGAEMMKTAHGP